MKTSHLILAGLGIAALSACSHHAGWGVKGTLADAPEGTVLALEANNAGFWYLIDSVAVNNDGSFAYEAAAPYVGQDILRLTLPGKGSIYFPVDSIDAVTIAASATNYGSGHTLGGTAIAATVGRVDSITASTSDLDELRQKLVEVITTDTTGIVAYYALGKSVGGKPVFDPNESLGNRAYGAVAQLYDMRRPTDPRADVIRKAYFDGRRALGKMPASEFQPSIEVVETGYFDIERYDARGNKKPLSELANGKTVVLNFTTYEHQGSPALNALLNEVYTKYHDRGLEIYQIAFDTDEVSWREAARNLPWTAVWNAPSDGSKVLMNYNITTLPTTFIIDRNGTLVERVENMSELANSVAKHI